MGSIDIIKPMSTVLSSVINISQPSRVKLLGTSRIEPGAAGCEARVLCGPPLNKLFDVDRLSEKNMRHFKEKEA